MGRRLSATLVLAAALLAAGCGGGDDDESSATAWADDVCSALMTWTGSLTEVADSLRAGNLSEDGLETVVEDVKDATGTLADDLKDLGPPDTDAGDEAKESLDALADELEDDVEQIESAVEDVSGVSEVLAAVSTVSGTLVTMGNQVSTTFSGLEQLDAQGELEDAFREAESCSSLTESS